MEYNSNYQEDTIEKILNDIEKSLKEGDISKAREYSRYFIGIVSSYKDVLGMDNLRIYMNKFLDIAENYHC